jgi:hypothetical protein
MHNLQLKSFVPSLFNGRSPVGLVLPVQYMRNIFIRRNNLDTGILSSERGDLYAQTEQKQI